MTDPQSHDDAFGQLAAGHALHALDPPDELRFAQHLPSCAQCQALVRDFTEAAAALADGLPGAEPGDLLRPRIMAAVAREPRASSSAERAGAASSRATVPGRRPSRRAAAILASAAAAILIAGGTVWGLSASGGGPTPPSAGCGQAGTCREVQLTEASTHAPAGTVIVAHGTAWLKPAGIPADHPARQIYVLWQVTGSRTPLAVGSFDITGHHGRTLQIGSLPVPFGKTWAFAVSIEKGRTIPPHPSHPVALGQVTSASN